MLTDISKTSIDAIHMCIGRVINEITIRDNSLVIKFDNLVLEVLDDGQRCCESRYMTCDDDLDSFKGDVFLSIDIKSIEYEKNDNEHDDVHEVQFLEIITNKGVFQIVNHNEHNGYYGGFGVSANITSL